MSIPDLCFLLQDGHFLLKLFDFILTFIGFRYFFEGSRKKMLESMIINLAVPGGLISICVLLFLYYKREKNGSIEPMLLTIYGVMNLLSGFIYLHECINANTCPMAWKIFEPSFIKTATCLGTSFTMLGESASILYLPDLQGKSSDYAYGAGFGEPYYEPVINDPYKNTRLNDSYQKPRLSDPYEQPKQNVHYEQPRLNDPYEKTMLNDPYEKPRLSEPRQRPKLSDPYQEPRQNEPYKEPFSSEPFEETGLSGTFEDATASSPQVQRRSTSRSNHSLVLPPDDTPSEDNQ